MKIKIFGEMLQYKDYHEQEVAYVVLTIGDLFAVVKECSEKRVLPGGKIKRGKSKKRVPFGSVWKRWERSTVVAVGRSSKGYINTHHAWAMERC